MTTSAATTTSRSSAGSHASPAFLREYMESVAGLPAELQRNFLLIRELDRRSQELQQNITEQCTLRLEEVMSRCVGEGSSAHRERIISERTAAVDCSQNECLRIADEKVALASKTYDLVDGHIRRLDKDMKKFEEQLKKERELLGDGGMDMNVVGYGREGYERTEGAKGGGKGGSGGVLLAGAMGGDAMMGGPAIVTKTVNLDLDLPVDPNEPTYCFCNQVSFGEMIACDNPSCKIEWFHFECVGLTTTEDRPKGKWYCPACAVNMKKRKSKSR